MANIIEIITQDKLPWGNSARWVNWVCTLSLVSCKYCVEMHGTIKDISHANYKAEIEAHPNCRCIYVPMRTKLVGTATDQGESGADVYLRFFNILPDYYVTKEEAWTHGWKKNLAAVLPGKMIGGYIYQNKDKKLPDAIGRIWYEADINYTAGKRNRQRILYSNDGLLFVTYDHYHTFYEITE